MSSELPVTRFGEDTTLHWSCRPGDFILWFTIKSVMHLMGDPENAWTIMDFWEMRDGDFAKITNRIEDLPPSFELHPSEVCNHAAWVISERMKAGCTPGEIMEGPNIWRVRVGDRLAWAGPSRPGMEAVDSLLSIVQFEECALVIGESNRRMGLEEFIGFGSPSEAGQSPEKVARCRRAYEAVRNLGIPRSIADVNVEWVFG